MVSSSSKTALSFSAMFCQHICGVWLDLPQVEQVVPYAGQWTRRTAVRSCLPWPRCPQKQHVALGFTWSLLEMSGGVWSLCGFGLGGLRGLVLLVWFAPLGVGCRCCRLYPLVRASSPSSMALAMVGVVMVIADRFPAALTSTKRMVSSTVIDWLVHLRRSSWISASARPMQSWSATLSSPWLLTASQPEHFFTKRHTSAWPLSLAANDRIGSPLSCIIRERATLATFGFSSLTARALIAARRSASGVSSIGKGPTALRVTSRLSLVSRHSSNWMLASAGDRCTAWEYALHLVRK